MPHHSRYESCLVTGRRQTFAGAGHDSFENYLTHWVSPKYWYPQWKCTPCSLIPPTLICFGSSWFLHLRTRQFMSIHHYWLFGEPLLYISLIGNPYTILSKLTCWLQPSCTKNQHNIARTISTKISSYSPRRFDHHGNIYLHLIVGISQPHWSCTIEITWSYAPNLARLTYIHIYLQLYTYVYKYIHILYQYIQRICIYIYLHIYILYIYINVLIALSTYPAPKQLSTNCSPPVPCPSWKTRNRLGPSIKIAHSRPGEKRFGSVYSDIYATWWVFLFPQAFWGIFLGILICPKCLGFCRYCTPIQDSLTILGGSPNPDNSV